MLMQKKRGILRLLRSPGRYIKHKISSIYKKLVKKKNQKKPKVSNILENEVNSAENYKKKSNELKEIAKLRRIKNRYKFKKEDLITGILESESSNA